jgi:hypothetical protein
MHRILAGINRELQNNIEWCPPFRGKYGTDWLVSRVWSKFLKDWLREHFGTCRLEFSLPKRRRLDAALCLREEADLSHCDSPMDLALEWEWDESKVRKSFPQGDFRKLFELNAICGLAIVQSRVDRNRGQIQSETILDNLREAYWGFRKEDPETAGQRDIALVEIRRVEHTPDHVRFEGYWWLNGFEKATELREWKFSSE